MTLRLLTIAAISGLLLAALVALLGCAARPAPAAITRVDCPQPTLEALAPAEPLPAVPELSASPGEAVGQLAVVIASDDAWAANEIARREALIEHGVQRCGWTR